MKHKSIFDFTNPNMILLAINISRVYEIATIGNHSIKIIPTEHCRNEDIDLLYNFYNLQNDANPDIIIELAYSANDVINCFCNNRAETLEDINARLQVAHPNVNNDLCNTSITLLKTAINRLELGVNDVLIIHRVAKSIAQLSGSEAIKVEHVAEAIQYRSIKINL